MQGIRFATKPIPQELLGAVREKEKPSDLQNPVIDDCIGR